MGSIVLITDKCINKVNIYVINMCYIKYNFIDTSAGYFFD